VKAEIHAKDVKARVKNATAGRKINNPYKRMSDE
jgi:hypothetical protein